MIIRLCIRWWYGPGLHWVWHYALTEPLSRCAEAFSLKVMLKTLAAPYKQTYSGGMGGPLGDRMRGAVDTFISRIVGFLVRSVIILAGILSSLALIAGGLLVVAVWPILPILPLVSVLIQIAGTL